MQPRDFRAWMRQPGYGGRRRAAARGGRIHSKPRQAQAMISRALAAGAPFAWFTADETCGQAKWLQAWLEDQDVC